MFFRTAVFGFVLALLSGVYLWADSIKHNFYIFSPPKLHALTLKAIELYPNSTAGVVHHIVTELEKTHGKYITPDPFPNHPEPGVFETLSEKDQADLQKSPLQSEWFFSNAGGAMGTMYVIHASLTEYLIIFGTPLGTEGHTGRHTADDYFHILEGEQWAFPTNSLQKEVYKKGSMHWLPQGSIKQYKMHEGCFALELAQGWIPPMMPFGLADTIFSTLDFPTLYHTVRISAREMIRNIMQGKM